MFMIYKFDLQTQSYIKILMGQNEQQQPQQDSHNTINFSGYLKKINQQAGKNQIFEFVPKFLPTSERTDFYSRELFDKFHQQKDKGNLSQWDQWELQVLKKMYIDHGSSWLHIAHALSNKTESMIKNRFYWLLKRGVNHLNFHIKSERKLKGLKYEWSINFQALKIFLNLSNQIQKWAIQNQLSISKTSKVFNLKKQVIEYCFCEEKLSIEIVQSLIRGIKEACFYFKSHRAFKAGDRRKVKLDAEYIRKVYFYDKFVNEQLRMNQLLSLPGKALQQDRINYIRVDSYDRGVGQLSSLNLESSPYYFKRQIELREQFLSSKIQQNQWSALNLSQSRDTSKKDFVKFE